MPPKHVKPKKLYKGKKRICLKHLCSEFKRLLKWALTINVGDYIATCEGCNRKVAKIEYIWYNEALWRGKNKPNAHWWLAEVALTDTNGRYHVCPGGGCALPKETVEQIKSYFKNDWNEDVELDEFGEIVKPYGNT